MTTTEFDLFRGHRAAQVHVPPEVKVGAGKVPLGARVARHLVRVAVDLHLGLPDSFELTFVDPAADVLSGSGLALGAPVEVGSGGATSTPLVDGEITSIEGVYGDGEPLTIVRGFSLDHRLQRVRRTRTFVNVKDSDIARQLAGDAGIQVGTIDATPQVHPVLGQDNQSDWGFLRERAEEIGYEVGVAEGRLHFRRATTLQGGGASVVLTAYENMIRLAPRISAANLVPEVEVRAWDPVNAQAKAVRKPVASPGVDIGAGDAAAAARVFVKGAAPPAAAGEMGPAPSPQAYVVYDRALTIDSGNTQALTDTASALAEQLASGFAEAEGEMFGDPEVVAGTVLQVKGVPSEFEGSWTVTRARHVFDGNTGYRTWFSVTGRQDRSTLSLAAGRGNNQGPTRIKGVAGAVVTSIEDPLGLGRVKVALPWLSPDHESAWAPVVQLGAGKASGTMFLPEPGDQVLVAFEFGDLRRPYVLGAVVNKRTGMGGALQPGGQPGTSAVKSGHPASVIRRGLVTPTGSRLVFHDDAPPSGGKPVASQVLLTTGQDKLGLTLDAVKGELRLVCTPGSPPGRLVIECDGNVEIKAGPSGTLTVDGGQMLTLKGKTVQVEGTGPVAVKGKPIQLN